MAKKRIGMEYLFNNGVNKDIAKNSINIVLSDVENKQYKEHLLSLFNFGLEHDLSLFTTIWVDIKQAPKDMCRDYLVQWCKNYIDDRDNPALKKPLKNYGEKDLALVERVSANTGKDSDTLKEYLEGHFIYMSAENMNGAILEEYLAEVLEPHGWHWCAGSVFRAVDFCYLGDEETVLLQVKNKYNTENSSSSAIRDGTEIKKWNRLNRPQVATGRDKPIPNWDKLTEIVPDNSDLSDLLNEDSYLNYIRENSSKSMDTLN